MKTNPRAIALAGVLTICGFLGMETSSARADDFPDGGYPGGGYGGYYGGGAAVARYYGNGGHDMAPHWHRTTTPLGMFMWYGNGSHDLQPHEHTISPYSGYRGYSVSPFGVTESFYPSTPYTYMPW
jgi:hypothetical protein